MLTFKKGVEIMAECNHVFIGKSDGVHCTRCGLHMHWVQFSTLLRGLPSGTRLADVIEIRQMDVPAPTKDNGKYRAKIAQMKTKYAIRKRSTSLQDGIVGLCIKGVSKERNSESAYLSK